MKGLSPELVGLLEEWGADTCLFAREAVGFDPEPWQVEAWREFDAHDKIAVRSGHGVGKTAWLAVTIIKWLVTKHPCKVGCTAPSSNQLFDALWPEIMKWIQRLPAGLKETLEWKSERVERVDSPQLCFAVAKTARRETPEALAGLHSEHMLFVIDEAAGVDQIIFETAEGAMSTVGAKTIMTGNPTRLDGYFFDAFHVNRPYWRQVHVSCMQSSRTNLRWVEEKKKQYGEDSNFFRVRVLGEFPRADDDSVIPLDLVEAAVNRDVEQSGEVEVWGLDPARKGDRIALAKRRGNWLVEPVKVWQNKDATQVVGLVKMEYDKAHKKPEVIFVDSIGLGGPIYEFMIDNGLPAVGINIAESHPGGDRYLRLKDELWFDAKAWFEKRDCKIPDDRDLIAELTCPRWWPTPSGKMKVEGKDEVKKRLGEGGRSPDLADAFVLTFPYGYAAARARQKRLQYLPMGYA